MICLIKRTITTVRRPDDRRMYGFPFPEKVLKKAEGPYVNGQMGPKEVLSKIRKLSWVGSTNKKVNMVFESVTIKM